MQMSQLSEAEPLYLEAERIYRQNGEEGDLELANTLRGLALIRETNGELEESGSLWREAREIYSRRDEKGAVAECDRKLSLLHQKPV
jgi:hypothetical protein